MAQPPTLEELYEALEAAPHSTQYQPDRGAYVLYHYYVLGYSLERIAARMFVSKATVQQTRRNAEQKLTVATLQRLKGVREVAHTPWREALDAKVRLIKYFRTNTFEQAHSIVGLGETDDIRMIGDHYREMVKEVEPIWVAPNIGTGIVNNLCDENTVFDMDTLAIPKHGLVWFGHPLTRVVKMLDGSTVSTVIRGVMYGIDKDPDGAHGLFACAWQQSAVGLHPVTINAIANGESIEEWIIKRAVAIETNDTPGRSVMNDLYSMGLNEDVLLTMDALESVRSTYGFMMRYLYTLFSFMNQRIIVHTPTAVDRNSRREAERHSIHPEVRVITWRLKKYQRMETEGRQVDWSCHWPSRAHDRHLADGRVIPIPGCIKGPRDKPYKPATPLVHQVTRT